METACGLTVIRAITFAIIWLITKHPTIRLYKYTVFFTWGMKTNFDVAVWLGLVFLSWLFWFKPHIKPLDWDPDDTAQALRYTTVTLLCLSVGAVYWLLKALLIRRLEAELHFYGSYGRIRRTILDLHGIRIIHKVLAYKNCWGLKQTLESSKAAIIELDRLLSFIVMLTMLIIRLLAMSILSTSKLAVLFSPFLASTFIFGNACQEVFHGLVFIFGMHPFHVGDCVVIDNNQMKVKKINLLTTTLFKYDTREVVVYPNSILASKSISNLENASDQGDSLEFTIDAETPIEEIADLENRIKK
ncbi:hypothetical protein Ancab_031470 [Ancistrocladus abbreviatus]